MEEPRWPVTHEESSRRKPELASHGALTGEREREEIVERDEVGARKNAVDEEIERLSQPGGSVAVFGLGAIGLAVVQGARQAKAGRIIAIDTNP